ncbi:MAG: DNA/RNA non-specific endonuclease [Siphonobacter sp.]
MRNNRFIFILVLSLIGLVLRYYNDAHLFERLKKDIFGTSQTESTRTEERNEQNPSEEYDSEASDTQTDQEDTSLGSLDCYLPAYTSDDQILRHDAYTLNYLPDYGEAAWVVHFVLNKTGKARRADSFQPDPLLKGQQVLPTDYSNSGYDRGHMAPAGDFNYDQNLKNQTFYMTNMSPQVHDLNIGFWNDIENKVRSWAKKRGDLVVVTGPQLKKGLPTIGRKTQVAVPEYYFKIVYDPQTQQAIAFWVPNQNIVEARLQDYTTSIQDVETKTGITFFAKLPRNVQTDIKTQHDVTTWFRRSRK